MKRSAAVAVAQVEAPAAEAPIREGLLRFALKPYQPRGSAHPPRSERPAQSIKDAVIRWLDEQL